MDNNTRCVIIDTTQEKRPWKDYEKTEIITVYYPCCNKILIQYEIDNILRCMKHDVEPEWTLHKDKCGFCGINRCSHMIVNHIFVESTKEVVKKNLIKKQKQQYCKVCSKHKTDHDNMIHPFELQ